MALASASAPTLIAGWRVGSQRGDDGFFHVVQHVNGQWWWRNPAGQPWFCRAVHDVRVPAPSSENSPVRDPAAQLRSWGFNAVGCGGDGAGREDGLPFMATVNFCTAGPLIVAPSVRLPDVFDPDWPARAFARAAEICPTWADERALLGWTSDDELSWAQPDGSGRPALLQICLSLEPGFAAYHAAWEFVLTLHGGRLDAVSRAWDTPLPNKETVRELTRGEKGMASRGYLRDDARWSREFARRYFTTTAAAIRAVDSHHVLLGCRFRARVGPAVLLECAYPAVDVAMLPWSELPAAGAPLAPLLASEVGWSDANFLTAGGGRGVRARGTTVERMLRRGRAALLRMARHPAVVGYVWRQWQDDPGEQPPFAHGLVHQNGAEAREHTELLAEFNPRAESLRRTATEPPSP
jgi:hypothetical protein